MAEDSLVEASPLLPLTFVASLILQSCSRIRFILRISFKHTCTQTLYKLTV